MTFWEICNIINPLYALIIIIIIIFLIYLTYLLLITPISMGLCDMYSSMLNTFFKSYNTNQLLSSTAIRLWQYDAVN